MNVIPVDDVDQTIEIANATAYGLAAGVHTCDIGQAMQFARGVEAGQISINEYLVAGDTVPFGRMKECGTGRERGMAALDACCEVKAVTVTL